MGWCEVSRGPGSDIASGRPGLAPNLPYGNKTPTIWYLQVTLVGMCWFMAELGELISWFLFCFAFLVGWSDDFICKSTNQEEAYLKTYSSQDSAQLLNRGLLQIQSRKNRNWTQSWPTEDLPWLSRGLSWLTSFEHAGKWLFALHYRNVVAVFTENTSKTISVSIWLVQDGNHWNVLPRRSHRHNRGQVSVELHCFPCHLSPAKSSFSWATDRKGVDCPVARISIYTYTYYVFIPDPFMCFMHFYAWQIMNHSPSMICRDAPGSAWGDWSLYTDSPLRAFENETGQGNPIRSGAWPQLLLIVMM